MIHDLKTLGLALMAILAIGAMVASAASAQGKLISDGPVTLDITEIGTNGSRKQHPYNIPWQRRLLWQHF